MVFQLFTAFGYECSVKVISYQLLILESNQIKTVL